MVKASLVILQGGIAAMRRINVHDIQEFYRFPKAFVNSDRYKEMSDAAKIIYMLLIDRMKDSLEEKRIDNEGYVYLFFSDSELSRLTGYGIKKVLNAKRELITKRLLRQVYIPSLKETRLYIGDFELDEGVESNLLEELVL